MRDAISNGNGRFDAAEPDILSCPALAAAISMRNCTVGSRGMLMMPEEFCRDEYRLPVSHDLRGAALPLSREAPRQNLIATLPLRRFRRCRGLQPWAQPA